MVLVLVCVCCTGVGALSVCLIKAKTQKELKQAPKAQQQMAGPGGVELQSEVDLVPQFHPNQDFDIDIFSNNKKRELKVNEEDFVNQTEQKLNRRDNNDLTGIEVEVARQE